MITPSPAASSEVPAAPKTEKPKSDEADRADRGIGRAIQLPYGALFKHMFFDITTF